MIFSGLFKILRKGLGLAPRRRPARRSKPKKKKPKKILRRRAPRRAVRRAARRPAARRSRRRSPRPAKVSKPVKKKKPAVLIGTITHYFPKVKAAVVKLKKPLSVGDPVWIKGKTTDFRQTVSSLQIDRAAVPKARAGQEVGLEVMRDVREGDEVFVSA
jgi:hypothetical protein